MIMELLLEIIVDIYVITIRNKKLLPKKSGHEKLHESAQKKTCTILSVDQKLLLLCNYQISVTTDYVQESINRYFSNQFKCSLLENCYRICFGVFNKRDDS